MASTRHSAARHTPEDVAVLEHGPLVTHVARDMARRLPANVDYEDLVQDGFVGLLQALIKTARTTTEEQYRAYLSQRIRGAILDGLRQADPGSRRLRKSMRRVEKAISLLSHILMRPPTEGEVAVSLSMSLRDYQRLLQDADGYVLLSLEDMIDSEGAFLAWCACQHADPALALEMQVAQRAILAAMHSFTDGENRVMTHYYVDDLTMRETAHRMGVTEGRVSQIHAQAIAKLRAGVFA